MHPASGESATPAEFFGLLARIRLTAFEERAADAARAGCYEHTLMLGRLSVSAFAQFERLRDRLIELGADPKTAMEPFEEHIAAYHRRTRPADGLEALVKVYVGDMVMADLYVALAGVAEPDLQMPDIQIVVAETLADTGHMDLLSGRLRAAGESDPALAARLKLWGRRLVGEARAQVHAIADAHPALGALAGDQGMERVFAKVLEGHDARMSAIYRSD